MSFQRHHARVVLLGRYGALETPLQIVNSLADEEWQGAVARGGVAGLRRYDLGQFDADEMEEKKRRAIGPAFTPRFFDANNRVSQVTPRQMPELEAHRADRLDELTTQRRKLEEKLSNDLTDDDKQTLADLRGEIADLKVFGYLEAVPDAFGDGTNALYHRLGADGVPSAYELQNFIGADEPFSLRLFFWRPRGDNVAWKWSFDWGWWRLTFDDHGVELTRFNEELSPAQREAMETQIDALRDSGRLTLQDREYIAARRANIAQIKAGAKDNGRSLASGEQSGITAAEKEIEARQNAKRGLSPADEKQIADLKKKLLRDTSPVNFYQASKDLFNQALTLTVIPDSRGYVTFHLGELSWTYEDTTLRKKGYRGAVWPKSKPRIKCSSGPYVWQRGGPEFVREWTLALRRRRLSFDPQGRDWNIVGDWDGDNHCSVEFKAETVAGSGGDGIPPEVDLKITFKSDGTRGARLHGAQWMLAPGPRRADDAVYFDSDAHLDEAGAPPIEEMEIAFDDDRDAATYTITLLDTDGVLELDDLQGRVAQIWLDGELIERLGIVKAPKVVKAGAPPSSSGPALRRANTRVELVIGDQWAIMDSDPAGAVFPVDGFTQGKAIAVTLEGRGVMASDRTDVDETFGCVLGREVPRGKIALRDEPRYKPGENTTRGAWLRHLAEQDAGGHLRLERGRWSWGARSTDAVASFSSDALDGARGQILAQLDLPDDTSDTFNCFRVRGRKDPKTGERIDMTFCVFESISDASDLRYIGFEKWFDTETDDALETEEMVLRRLEALAETHCKSVKRAQIATWLDLKVRPLRRVEVDGLPYEVKGTGQISMARDRMTFVARRLE